MARRQQVFAQALFGAAYEWTAKPSLTICAAQIAFVQTELPNGTNSRQRNVQFGAGLVFRVPTFTRQR